VALDDQVVVQGTSVGAADPGRVFVVHGRDLKTRDELYHLIRAYGLQPVEWDEAVHATGSSMPSVLDVVSAGMTIPQAVIVLLTPDDEGVTKVRYQQASDSHSDRMMSGQPRLNVVFEAGRASALFPGRTTFLSHGQVRLFTDVSGIHMLRIGHGPQWRAALRLRLQNCGCSVSPTATSWTEAGKFDEWLQRQYSDYREARFHYGELLDRDQLSDARLQRDSIAAALAAYCLVSACQFDYDIPYWLHQTGEDEDAALMLAQFIIVSPDDHERPPYRAARALELMPKPARDAALERVRNTIASSDLSGKTQEIIDAVSSASVMELVRTTTYLSDDLRNRLLADLVQYPSIRTTLM
jgi:hypothetical protein